MFWCFTSLSHELVCDSCAFNLMKWLIYCTICIHRFFDILDYTFLWRLWYVALYIFMWRLIYHIVCFHEVTEILYYIAKHLSQFFFKYVELIFFVSLTFLDILHSSSYFWIECLIHGIMRFHEFSVILHYTTSISMKIVSGLI